MSILNNLPKTCELLSWVYAIWQSHVIECYVTREKNMRKKINFFRKNRTCRENAWNMYIMLEYIQYIFMLLLLWYSKCAHFMLNWKRTGKCLLRSIFFRILSFIFSLLRFRRNHFWMVWVCVTRHDINYGNVHQAKQIPVNTKLKVYGVISVCLLIEQVIVTVHCRVYFTGTHTQRVVCYTPCGYTENINKTIFWF